MPSSREERAHANTLDAARDGAYGMCLGAVEQAMGLVAVHRAPHKSGVDYFLNSPDKDVRPLDLESAIVFEVSGIGPESSDTVATRKNRKVDQLKKGTAYCAGHRGIAGVVGFEEKALTLEAVP